MTRSYHEDADSLRDRLYAEIEALMRAKGISQSEMARMLGVDHSTVNAFFSRYRVSTIDTFLRYLTALDHAVEMRVRPKG